MTKPRPILLLTRPERQAQAFARAVTEKHGAALEIVISPVMRIEPGPDRHPPPPGATLIFSSVNGVEAFAPLHNGAVQAAFCVGARTAEAARGLGLDPVESAPDARALLEQIVAARPDGPLCHLRGEHTRGDIVETLRGKGFDVSERVLYRQTAQLLSTAAQAALAGDRPVCVPVFSPRTAELLAKDLRAARAPLHLIALSPSVAAHLPGPVTVARAPNAGEMRRAIAAWTALESKGRPS